MGIGIVGIREIAKSKNNKEELDKTFSGLIILNTLSTSLMLIVLIISIYTIPKLYEYKEMMYLGALKLVANYLLIEWLYKGLENFKYITIRTVLVKCLYVLSVFLFVHEAEDYPIYYALLVGMIVINAIFNVLYARHFVSFRYDCRIIIQTCFKPFLVLGIYALLTSMYTSFNVAYLGFVAGETEVGYYTTATKFYSIFLALFSAFTGVLLPRMSSLIAENKVDEFKLLLNKSVDILITFSIPVILFTMIMAPELIELIAGKGYEGAIIPFRIIMPLMLIIGYEQILIIQALMPLKEDKIILKNSILGATTGLILNILLVSHFRSIGSSIVWIISEIVVLISAQFNLFRIIKFKFPFKKILKELVFYSPLIVFLIYFQYIKIHFIVAISTAGILASIYMLLLQIILKKNIITIDFLKRYHKK